MEEQSFYSPTTEERIAAILAHILAIVPGIGILGPLVIWLVKRNEPGFVEANAKESLNFQLTMILISIAAWILAFILIGFLLLGLIWILNLVLVIVASVRASENKVYRYPLNLRLIK